MVQHTICWRDIHKTLHNSPIVKHVDDLHFHDYGPENRIIFVRVSLDTSPHDPKFTNELNKIKTEIKEKFNIDETTIYWPPSMH